MSRPYSMPDPKDRSVNSPSIIAKAPQILGLYNSQHKNAKKERVVDSVKEWYSEQALNEGWTSATFHGSECLLEASVQLDNE